MLPDVVKGFWAEGNAEWYFVHVIWVDRVDRNSQEEDGLEGGEKMESRNQLWLVNWQNHSQIDADVAMPFHCHHGSEILGECLFTVIF